jgi:hypothetical protein
MSEWTCNVKSAAELDSKIREIWALENVGRGDEIHGALYVEFSDDSVKEAHLIPWLERRGVTVVWRRIA